MGRGEKSSSVVWFAKVFVQLQVTCRSDNMERQVTFLQSMKVQKTSRMVENVLGSICVRWSICNGRDHNICKKKLVGCSRNDGER